MESAWTKVDELRLKYPNLGDDHLPIDIFTFTEIDLGIDIIPFDDLTEKYGVEAALRNDATGVYIDAEHYYMVEKMPIWKQRRVRFSLAHELGHYFLHTDRLGQLSHSNAGDSFANWINVSSPEKYRCEQEANEFAGRLLVPVNRLAQMYAEFAKKIEPMFADFRSSDDLRCRFAQAVTEKFQVGEAVIRMRLDRDGIWEVN